MPRATPAVREFRKTRGRPAASAVQPVTDLRHPSCKILAAGSLPEHFNPPAVFVASQGLPGTHDFDELLAAAKPTCAPARTLAEDICYWGYTSGSTGKPKAAVHSHAHFLAAADLVGVGVFGLEADDLVFSAS